MLTKFISINNSLYTKVICTTATSNNELYNNNTRFESQKGGINIFVIPVLNLH